MIAASAIRAGHTISFVYQSHHGATSQRNIAPYAVLHTDDRWYLIGHCFDRQAIRTFRLDRVADLCPSTATFDRPQSFDPRQYLAEHLPFIQSDGRDNLDFFAAMLLTTRRRIVVYGPVELRHSFKALALEATRASATPAIL